MTDPRAKIQRRKSLRETAGFTGDARGFTLIELPAVSGREACGFTLVELLVVMAIISLLAGIMAVTVGYAIQQTETAQTAARMAALAQGLTKYHEDHHRYPGQDMIATLGAAANPGNYTGSQILAAAMLNYDYADGYADYHFCGNDFVVGEGTEPINAYIDYQVNTGDASDTTNTLLTLNGRMHVLADGFSEVPGAICYYPSIPMQQGVNQFAFAHNSIHTGSDNATFVAFITDGSLPTVGGVDRAYQEGAYLLIAAGHDREWFSEDDLTNWKPHQE